MSNDPKTITEQLDAARTGNEFHQALNNLFGILDTARDKEEGRTT